MRLADTIHALGPELPFQRLDERREHVQHQRPAFRQQRIQFRIDAGIDHDRPQSLRHAGAADFIGRPTRLVRGVDERKPVGGETGAGELGQQAVADGFGRDPGAIGDIEHGP